MAPQTKSDISRTGDKNTNHEKHPQQPLRERTTKRSNTYYSGFILTLLDDLLNLIVLLGDDQLDSRAGGWRPGGVLNAAFDGEGGKQLESRDCGVVVVVEVSGG